MPSDESENLIWRVQDRVCQELVEHLERELVLAFHRDYDGADEIVGSDERDLGDDFKLRAVVRPWNEGNEPHRPPWAAYHRRYEFGEITYQDLRESNRRIHGR